MPPDGVFTRRCLSRLPRFRYTVSVDVNLQAGWRHLQAEARNTVVPKDYIARREGHCGVYRRFADPDARHTAPYDAQRICRHQIGIR